ncbi:alpha/beta fold hydrolase [uncultured Ramlibacter sp.]|uniref:alpha/beta fold hydrolase n=1 Tax=uncultured Ramlibacter sp. TaxID=260755 RepID=UPI002637F559|nr:alpha/beta fold hydrolase [uncultured Ramlibacter sp.]
MAEKMGEKGKARHIVLIHGAWQGAWAFAAWLPLLRASGWQPHAVDLPGNGWPPQGRQEASLASYTAHVAALVERIAAPVIVLGHSGGGITASQVAQALPDRVAGLVYLAGMMLPTGMSFIDLVADVQAGAPEADLAGITPWLVHDAAQDTTTVRPEGALRCFLHDCEPAAAAHAAALLRPQPESGRAMRNQLSAQHFGRVPRVYVECRDDRSVLLPLQRRMQQLSPGAACVSMDCGHVPQLAQPALLTALLLPHLDALLDSHSAGEDAASLSFPSTLTS